MHFITLTPQAFETIALSWTGAISAVIVGIMVAWNKVSSTFKDLKASHAANAAAIAQNAVAINKQDKRVDFVLLNTPAPAQTKLPEYD